jgi:hypothetical protein
MRAAALAQLFAKPSGAADGRARRSGHRFRVFSDMIDDLEIVRGKQPLILFRIEAGVIERVSPYAPIPSP